MREWMTLLENAEAAMSPEQLANEARMWEGALQPEKAADFDWHFDPAFPIDKVSFHEGDDSTPASWAEWMKEEIKMWDQEEHEDGGFWTGRYDDLLNEDIREAIVLHIGSDGRGYVWDGCHRTGATAMKGLPTIAAIVGVRKQ